MAGITRFYSRGVWRKPLNHKLWSTQRASAGTSTGPGGRHLFRTPLPSLGSCHSISQWTGTNVDPISGTEGTFTGERSTILKNSRQGAKDGSHSSRWRSRAFTSGISTAILAAALYYNSQRRRINQMQTTLSPLGSWFIPSVSCAGVEAFSRRSKQYNFLAEAVETAAPSIVFIEKKESVATLFGEAVSVSSGSGFIVDETGYVLTNAHVVGNACRVNVKLQSGRLVDGHVTDMDEVADLALVKLDLPKGEKLPALKFGKSADIRPGEWVVALGSPLSLSNTITAGIVSSVLRPSKELGLQHYKPDMEYVQTDAPITIGNSGGPLVNLDGEVIGVNTMTAGPGISFAIPSDFAKNFLETANKTAEKKSGKKFAIGISMMSITPRVIGSTHLRNVLPREVTHGVLLANVWPNGAAAKAGLERGDVIVRINGKDIHSSNQVYVLVQSGKTLTMEVVRGAQWKTVIVHPETHD